jgi:hypothetical protein
LVCALSKVSAKIVLFSYLNEIIFLHSASIKSSKDIGFPLENVTVSPSTVTNAPSFISALYFTLSFRRSFKFSFNKSPYLCGCNISAKALLSFSI